LFNGGDAPLSANFQLGQLQIQAPDGGPVANITPFLSLDGSRCTTLGDTVSQQSGPGRLKWAAGCFPQWQQLFGMANSTATYNGKPVSLYPTFGRVDALGALVNPLKWIAPVDPTADCILPEGYVVIGMCAPNCNLSNRGANNYCQ
jgi:hypothetical protein